MTNEQESQASPPAAVITGQGSSPRYLRVVPGNGFEWFDFYLYGTLAVFFGTLFFPPGNETAAFLASLATFGAGFAVRPLGALIFGRIGDLVGRKYTFLITIVSSRPPRLSVLPTSRSELGAGAFAFDLHGWRRR
jgi:MFS family permease